MNRQITAHLYDMLDIALAFVTLEAVRVPESKLSAQPAVICTSVASCDSSRRRGPAEHPSRHSSPAAGATTLVRRQSPGDPHPAARRAA